MFIIGLDLMMERTCMGNDSQNALHLTPAAAFLQTFQDLEYCRVVPFFKV
jgi:hypothetical protein